MKTWEILRDKKYRARAIIQKNFEPVIATTMYLSDSSGCTRQTFENSNRDMQQAQFGESNGWQRNLLMRIGNYLTHKSNLEYEKIPN